MKAKKKTSGPSPLSRGEITAFVFGGGMPRALGMRLLALSRSRVSAEMQVKDLHRNRTGTVNGGAIMALADAAAAAGALANMPPQHRGGTMESKANFFAPAIGPVLKALSVPLHLGSTTSVWQTSITNSGDGERVAVVTQTQIYLPPLAPLRVAE